MCVINVYVLSTVVISVCFLRVFIYLFAECMLGYIMCTRSRVRKAFVYSIVTTAIMWKDGYCGYNEVM